MVSDDVIVIEIVIEKMLEEEKCLVEERVKKEVEEVEVLLKVVFILDEFFFSKFD